MAIDLERVKALCQAAVERDDPATRRAFFEDEIGDDAELCDRLDALLAAYDQPPTALDRSVGPDPRAAADAIRLWCMSLGDLGLSILDSLGRQA